MNLAPVRQVENRIICVIDRPFIAAVKPNPKPNPKTEIGEFSKPTSIFRDCSRLSEGRLRAGGARRADRSRELRAGGMIHPARPPDISAPLRADGFLNFFSRRAAATPRYCRVDRTNVQLGFPWDICRIRYLHTRIRMCIKYRQKMGTSTFLFHPIPLHLLFGFFKFVDKALQPAIRVNTAVNPADS